MKNLKILGVILIFFLVSLFIKNRNNALPKLGPFPSFKLQTQDNKEFSEKNFLGRKTVFSFFFTSCKGPCPALNANLVRIQKSFENDEEILFVSVTIDPDRDTPEVLNTYAKKIGADLKNWVFLTGDIAEIVKLSEGDLKLGIDPKEYNHSTKVIIIDRDSYIRGLIDSEGKEELKRLEAAIKTL